MFIIKNAFKCIGRSKGRNILIGIIVLVIAIAACLGLSIRQAAENAKQTEIENKTVTATISFDRQSAMENMRPGQSQTEGGRPSFDRNEFSQMMGENSSLTLQEYEKYAKSDAVSGYYYSLTASLNGSDDFLPVSNEETTEEEDSEEETNQQMPEGFGGMFGGGKDFISQMMGSQSDFNVVGYSSYNAMTNFVSGTAKIEEGAVFDADTKEYVCLITAELANYNNIELGDKITLCNPNNEEETYEFEVVGIYKDSTANEESFSFSGSTSSDPANSIYMSYNALSDIVSKSKESAADKTDSNTGMTFSTEMKSTLSFTYVLSDVESYEKFESDVRELGLDDSYIVSSSDVAEYENSLVPLNTLSKTAGYYLIVVLAIGAIILVVLNIFNVRERKYEIGVLTAMGMKKGKVAMQFLTEIFVVTIAAVIIGVVVGGAVSVPVTNALLEGQVEAQSQESDRMEDNFGREDFGNFGDFGGGAFGGEMGAMPGGNMERPDNKFNDMFGDTAVGNYITEVDSAMNLTVVAQMFLIAVLLTLISGAVGVLFVMRYDPLKILANRD